MSDPINRILKDQGRGVIGALLLGSPLLFTMETWWLGWRLPAWHLVLWGIGGLIVVIGVLRVAGFRKGDGNQKQNGPFEMAKDLAALVVQSLVAAFVVLLTFGILDPREGLLQFARIGLLELVPLGLGAAAANTLLSEKDAEKAGKAPFPKDAGIFAAGALFFSLPIVPTEEMALMAAHAGWWNLFGVMLLSLAVVYLALYELELRGQGGRANVTKRVQLGQTVMVFVIGLLVAFLILAGVGQFAGVPYPVWIQKTIVLGFPAAMGGATAQVVF